MRRDSYIAVSDLHRYRFARHKVLGLSLEEIAKEDGVKLATIEKSVRDVETQAAIFTPDNLETSAIEVVMFNKDIEKTALNESLQAEKKVYAQSDSPDGKVKAGDVIATEPDHDARLHASQILTDKTKAVLSKYAKGPTTNIQNTVGIINHAPTNSFEDRLREVLKRRDASPVQTDDLPAGEVLDIAVAKKDTTVGDSA